jgi:NitT/TauT family transport system permease protein/sulfonate transport system permease protein
MPEYILPSPIDVGRLTGRLLVDPDLARHTYTSFLRIVAAVGLALVLGTAFALLPRHLPLSGTLVTGRILPFLNAFPTLGWAMMALFWFGIGTTSVIFVEVAILLPFCMINVATGLNNLDGELLEMGRSFTRRPWRLLRRVVLPMLVPYLLAAARISFGVGWKIALVAELFGATSGLGYLLNHARVRFDSPMIFATIATIIVVAMAVDRLVFAPLERHLLRHQAPAQAGWAL